MSNWQVKSDTSVNVSNILIDSGFFNSSVHSSYYSCVQYVYHVMYQFFDEQIATIENGGKTDNKDTGAHVWLRKYIFDSIKPKDKKKAQHFRNEMSDMFAFRVQADYKYDNVSNHDATECRKKALAVIGLLKDHYEL